MDYLDQKKMIVAGSRTDLLGNSLVLIAPATSKLAPMPLTAKTDIAKLLGQGRLATGDPSHVPVGIYAKQTLTAMGQWKAIDPRLARAESVRAGLALVERAEVPLGIVYSTDAAITKKVKVIGTFPATLHKAIVYPAGLVAGNVTPAAKAFLAYLKTKPAEAVFAKYGFTVLK
jgi:molybdate transport system substrate-binding protein